MVFKNYPEFKSETCLLHKLSFNLTNEPDGEELEILTHDRSSVHLQLLLYISIWCHDNYCNMMGLLFIIIITGIYRAPFLKKKQIKVLYNNKNYTIS